MTAGSSVGALLVLAWAVADSLLAFYALWAVIGLVMASVLYEPAFAVVAVWFDRQRARALTALTLIAGFRARCFCRWPPGWYWSRAGDGRSFH